MANWSLDSYEEVKDRIPRFWEKHADGAIVTDLIFHDDRQYIVQAALINGAGQKIATGLAEEIVGSSPVNKTSALENCETSAIGRALANAGFSSGKNRPSREEMDKAARSDSPGDAGADRGASQTRPSSPGRPATDANAGWDNFLANPNGWWDNRNDKRNPKAPDFKAKKDNAVKPDGLWLDGLKKSHRGEEPVEVDELLSANDVLGAPIGEWPLDVVQEYVALMLGVVPPPKAERKKTLRVEDVATELEAVEEYDGAPF